MSLYKHKPRATRFFVLILVIAAVAIGTFELGAELTLKNLAVREVAFRQFQTDHPVVVYLVAFAVYVIVTGLSLPGAAALTLLFGWLFGFWRGFVVVSFGSTAGATVAFLLSRYLFRDAITARFGDRLSSFNEALKRDGAFYLFTLRLIPAVPFFVVNAVMGLTPLRVSTFWWVSQLGMLAGTAVYVYAGASVPNLQILADKGLVAAFTATQITQIVAAFVFLGLLPLTARFMLKQLAGRTS